MKFKVTITEDPKHGALFQYLSNPGVHRSTSDVTLVCDDGILRGHRLVLASVSSFLGSLFNDTMMVQSTVTLMLPDFSVEKVVRYLKMIYSNKQVEDTSGFEDLNNLFGMQSKQHKPNSFNEPDCTKILPNSQQPLSENIEESEALVSDELDTNISTDELIESFLSENTITMEDKVVLKEEKELPIINQEGRKPKSSSQGGRPSWNGKTLYPPSNRNVSNPSLVWKLAGFYMKDGKLQLSHAICGICGREVPFTNSPGNMKKHLTGHHKTQYEAVEKANNDQSKASCASKQR